LVGVIIQHEYGVYKYINLIKICCIINNSQEIKKLKSFFIKDFSLIYIIVFLVYVIAKVGVSLFPLQILKKPHITVRLFFVRLSGAVAFFSMSYSV